MIYNQKPTVEEQSKNVQIIADAKAGSKNAMLQLYQMNRRLIYKCVSGYECNRYPIEDLMQEAYFATVKAVEAYEPDSGHAFTTYLVNALKWYFSHFVRSDKNRLDYCILDAPISTEDADGTTKGELIEDEAAAFEDNVLHRATIEKAFDVAKKALGEKEEPYFDILYWRFACNATYAKIAELLGRSPDEVKKLEAYALRILRHPKHKAIYTMRDDVISASYHRSTLTEFRYTHTSSVEWAVQKMVNLNDVF